MNILLTGSHGLIGSALAAALAARGHHVVRLLRAPASGSSGDAVWDPATGHVVDPDRVDGMDAAVHLAGENLASGRWTAAKMARIRESRSRGTRLLAEMLAGAARPPRVLLCASAMGYYGDRGGEVVREESSPGTGFLAEVCREWEAAADPARRAGMRVVHLRFGVVLSAAGGVLQKILPVFRLGLGGPIGTGRQYMSWIAVDDVVGTVLHVLDTPALSGPVNIVSPHPATNREFTRTLGRVISRPTPFPVPAFALRILFGPMTDEALLTSVRAEPAKLAASGYAFSFPDLEPALRALLARR